MKVPVYDAPQVQPQAAPDVRVQAITDPEGGAIAQGVSQLGQGEQRLGDNLLEMHARAKMQIDRAAYQADATWATNAATAHKHDLNTGLYGDLSGGKSAPPAEFVGFHGESIDESVGHDAPTGPSEKALGALSDPTSGLSPKGLLNERGMAAAEYAHTTMAWGAKRMEDIAAQAPNARARQMFLHTAGTNLEDALVSVERHTEQQRWAAKEASVHAATAATLAGVTNNYFDAASVERQLSALEPSIRALQLSTEDGNAKIASVRQEAYRGVVRQFLEDKDFKGAQAAFTQHADALGYGKDGAEQRAQLEHTIGVLRDQQEGTQAATKIVGDAKLPGGLVDIAKIDRDVLAVPPEKQTKAFMDAVSSRKTLAQSQNVSTVSQAYGAAASQWEQTKDLSSVDASTRSWMESNDPDGWHKLEAWDAQYKAAQQSKGRGHKVEPTAEQSLFTNRVRTAIRDNPDNFKDVTPDDVARAYAGHVTPDQLEKIQDGVRAVHGQKPANDKALMPTQVDAVIQVLRDSGAVGKKDNPAKMKGETGLLFDRIEDSIQKQREAWKNANKGAEPPVEKVQEWAAQANKPVTIKGSGWIWDDKVPRITYESEPKYRGKEATDEKGNPVSVSTPAAPVQIPNEDRGAITSILLSRKVQPTEDAIRKVYEQKHGGGGAPAQTATPRPGGLSAELKPTPQPPTGRHKLVMPETRLKGQQSGVSAAAGPTPTPPTQHKPSASRDTHVHPTLAGLMQQSLDAGALDNL